MLAREDADEVAAWERRDPIARLEAIRAVCEAVGRPVNVVMGLRPPLFSVAELQDAGVKRISVGGAFARAALGAFMRAAREVKEAGSFYFAGEAMTGAEVSRYMAGPAGVRFFSSTQFARWCLDNPQHLEEASKLEPTSLEIAELMTQRRLRQKQPLRRRRERPRLRDGLHQHQMSQLDGHEFLT